MLSGGHTLKEMLIVQTSSTDTMKFNVMDSQINSDLIICEFSLSFPAVIESAFSNGLAI